MSEKELAPVKAGGGKKRRAVVENSGDEVGRSRLLIPGGNRARATILGYAVLRQAALDAKAPGRELINARSIAIALEIGKTPIALYSPPRIKNGANGKTALVRTEIAHQGEQSAGSQPEKGMPTWPGPVAPGKSAGLKSPLTVRAPSLTIESLSIKECFRRKSDLVDNRIDFDRAELSRLLAELSDLRVWILRRSSHSRFRAVLKNNQLDPADLAGIINLRHYLAFRSRDLRSLQDRLSALGCSSLGRSEVHVIDALERVLNLLRRILLPEAPPVGLSGRAIDRKRGYELLARNTFRLLGPEPAQRSVRIMVTMPSEAADDYGLVRQLAESGMNVARINCAHDTPEAWLRMIDHVRRAGKELGRSITIAADLAGHKIRTGPLALETGVLHLRPKRDRFGRVQSPARLRLLKPGAPTDETLADLLRPRVVLSGADGAGVELVPGDRLHFTDSRNAKRSLLVESVDEFGAWAVLAQATFLTNGTAWRLRRSPTIEPEESEDGLSLPTALADLAPAAERELGGIFSAIPDEPVTIRLRRTDHLLLTREQEPGREAPRNADGMPVGPARIACTLPKVFEVLQVGQAVWIDDGKFGAKVVEIGPEGALLEITACRPGGARLLADKGLNFPGLALGLPGLARHDIAALKVLAGQVEVINYSFVETGSQIGELLAALRHLGAAGTGVIAKIETARAFHNLAEIALAAMGRVPFGIMIARGDLAVEVGPERLAEVQEEILWLSEAGHLPVVWATQVMETMVKKGVISRPELTDAAMGERAECVMLNKGPFIEKALLSLNNIFSRMQEHQRKKSSRLRALSWGRNHDRQNTLSNGLS